MRKDEPLLLAAASFSLALFTDSVYGFIFASDEGCHLCGTVSETA